MKSSDKMERFFPNECYVCKSRDKLIRCGCKMICYCSEDHRLEHLSVHGSFCKVIKELLIEKKVSHIHEKLQNLKGPAWTKEKEEIGIEVTNKLGRPMSLLEYAMWKHPRACIVCNQTRQEDLKNCPDCPVASFCKKHLQDELHSMNCKVMNQYLKILKTAEELNIDLKFLSPIFPCITEEEVNQVMDALTLTYVVSNMKERCLKSRLLKMDLINFMDTALKINSALQKLHDTIPEEMTIHIDALSYEHAITKENYWEFLLHLNPQIKKLKIIIVKDDKENDNIKIYQLCKECKSSGRTLSVKSSSLIKDNFKDQVINVLFYLKVENISKILNRWETLKCPVVFRFDSKLNFYKAQHFQRELFPNYIQFYEGQLNSPFGMLSSFENEDIFLILKPKEKEEEEEEEGRVNKQVTVELENFDHKNYMFVRRHISQLVNKNNELQKKLNSTIEEKNNLEIKLKQVSNELNKKNEVISKISRDIGSSSDKENETETPARKKKRTY
ncbi:uncharacterized protein LOC122508673 isoform X2 [Leptopilina heterotoma]|uniref:uncharacterized protein LOC122508673 isoform X2 n=1 Tax=Leptopilina heterotoma TaxID=63436 RepID=UPI001CA83640|nr:uncharacterized protein LOC122508673 isoform X2 [Leptopilina heterotoma]XP_043478090.1 uncharacterized protein LOC122508673 isoform X2 [Leptopilina heterotoma]